MSGETELHSKRTAWVRGRTNTKLGQGILTSERLIFFDEKFSQTGVGGALGGAIADRLQKRHEEGGPLLELPLADITAIRHEKKLLNKDLIVLSTAGEEYRFNDGWKDWSPLLKQALIEHHGRRVVDESPDSWRVENASG